MTLPPTFPVADHDEYQAWLAAHHPSPAELAAERAAAATLPLRPLISVVVPVFDPPERFLREAVGSVLDQTYDRFELCLVDDGSRSPTIRQVLDEYAARDGRVRLTRHEANRGIVAASNRGLDLASGDFVAFLDHDDLLAPSALFAIAACVASSPDADMIYTDEDKVDCRNVRSAPFFKPDWCPDSFLSRMYTCHLSAYRRSLVEEIGRFRSGFEGGQSYDLALRLTERTSRIHHIPKVLYHWRMHSESTAADDSQKLYVYEADRRALQDAVDRRGEPGMVVRVPGELACYAVRYQILEPRKVSIVLPSRDHGEMLNMCLGSVFARTTWTDFEVILVDNGSSEPRALEVITDWSHREPERFRAVRLDIPFNFSTLCNTGARAARGDYLLFLNNDTEVITPDWIGAMVEQAQRRSIGAVGALLLYEDGTIQHAGAIMGLGGLAAHSHRGLPSTTPGYAGQVASTNNYLSVAGTCLMLRRVLFEECGGFDERLPGDYEDVDLCLKLWTRGLRNVVLPHVRLFHYESISRGKDYVKRDPDQRSRATKFIRERWQKYIDHDPCYNPNLTRGGENYAIDVAHVRRLERTRRRLSGRYFDCTIDRVAQYGDRTLRIEGRVVGRSDSAQGTTLQMDLDGAAVALVTADPNFRIAVKCDGVLGFWTRLRLTLHDPRGTVESFSFRIGPRAPHHVARIARTSLIARLHPFLRRFLDPAHTRFPTTPQKRLRGAFVGLTLRVASRSRLIGPVRLASRAFPTFERRFRLDAPVTYDSAYRRWLRHEHPDRERLAAMRACVSEMGTHPLISVIMPVFNMEATFLSAAIDSVRAQVYPHWQLCIADDASTESHVRPLLEDFARRDSRIRVLFRDVRGNISEASNSALSLAEGDFVAQLDHDDLLAPHALFRVAELLNREPDLDFIYSDEDKVNPYGVHWDPFFKPDWSPESFLTKMYTCHLGVYRRSLIHRVGGFRSAFDGAEDYDLVLRIVERTSRISHIPDILYHWRSHPASTATGRRNVKAWAYTAGARALQNALDRREEPASVSGIPGAPGFYEVRFHRRKPQKPALIVPARDQPRLLDRCLLSVFERTTCKDFEVMLVDNGSCETETFAVIEKWLTREPGRFRTIRVDIPFNFSTLSNRGAAASSGTCLVFLNSDTEVITDDWLEILIEQAQRPAIGAVGPLLLYPNRTVQHAGVIVGMGGAAGHAHRRRLSNSDGYFGRLITMSNVAAVTGACLMCRREVFESAGGFDEAFDSAYGDVDFCLRLLERGLRNVYVPRARLYHRESQTLGTVSDGAREESHQRAVSLFQKRWGAYVAHDPYYSPHLSRTHEDYVIDGADSSYRSAKRSG